MFSCHSDNCILIHPYLDITTLFAAEFENPTNGISGIGLTLSQTSPGLTFYMPAIFCKSFENSVEKVEIARNEQFLLFPQCFLCVWRNFFHFSQI